MMVSDKDDRNVFYEGLIEIWREGYERKWYDKSLCCALFAHARSLITYRCKSNNLVDIDWSGCWW